jgi:hypothetical protein
MFCMKLLYKLLFLMILCNLSFFSTSAQSKKAPDRNYDAKKLLADVKAMVDASKKETGTTIKQPGIK